MKTLLSYKNDPKLKKMLLGEITKHRKADQLTKGIYGKGKGKNFKGCAVGCSIFSLNEKLGKSYSTSNHSAYEIELGIPAWLAQLEDVIFEGLPTQSAMLWPERFTEAIPVGVDLTPIRYKFSVFILKENIERVLKLDIEDNLKEEVLKAIKGILVLHEKAALTGKWNANAANAAWSVARSAERSAESSAANAANAAWSVANAASAAWSAAWSVANAASAAWSVARSAAWSVARSAGSAAHAESAARSAENAANAASAERSAERSAEWSAANAESAESAARSAASAASAAYERYADHLILLLEEAH